jgi:hypothetical protein
MDRAVPCSCAAEAKGSKKVADYGLPPLLPEWQVSGISSDRHYSHQEQLHVIVTRSTDSNRVLKNLEVYRNERSQRIGYIFRLYLTLVLFHYRAY